MKTERDPFGRKGSDQEADPFGNRSERSVRNRLLSSRLGRRVTAGLITLGLAAGGANEGVKLIMKSGNSTKTEQVSKNPSQDINADENLPIQLQMGSERATLDGVVRIKNPNKDINAHPDLPEQLRMGGQRAK